jgi:hypothetical protein
LETSEESFPPVRSTHVDRIGERGKTALFVAFDCRTLEKLETVLVFSKILDTDVGNLSW